jgi:hypothetical protein
MHRIISAALSAIAALVALIALAGCNAPQAAPTSTPLASTRPPALATPVPTLRPTSAASPAPTSATSGPPAPTAAPTVAPAGGGILPAPIYVLDNGQIARIERNGKTRALVTSEKVEMQGLQPIATFAMAPTGDMAYVVGDVKADRLVRAGPHGEDKHTIYEAAGHELSDLVWSSDGAQIYMRLLNNREPPDTPSGIYRIAAAGGTPELLHADDPVDNVANPSPSVSGYRPFAISPDGKRLLVEVYSLYYDGCGLGVLPLDGGDTVARLTVPQGTKTFCGEATWSPDSAAVYFLAGPESGPTIWRGDAASGATTAQAAPDMLARAPLQLASGALRLFQVRRDPAGAMTFTMADMATAQAAPAPLGAPFSARLGRVLWFPDGSGAVISVESADAEADLRWVPADGSPMSLPNTGQGIVGIAWGR